MGAVVGALYASGMKPYEMLEIMSGKGFLNLFRLKPSLSGLLEMRYLNRVLESKTPERFEDLQIPLFICATNLSRGECKIFNSGRLRPCIAASASIPVVFEPVEIDGDKFVDGGVLNNLPASACKDQCDYILGVEVNRGKFTRNLKTMKHVALEVFHLVVNKNSHDGMRLCDGLIRPEMEPSFDIFDFGKARALFDLGYEQGCEWAEGFLKEFDQTKLPTESVTKS
jgi:NTE family protein